MAVRDTVGELVDRGEHISRGIADLSRDLADYAHLATSREGLFARPKHASRSSHRRDHPARSVREPSLTTLDHE